MTDIDKTIEDLVRIYDEATGRLRSDIMQFADDGSLPSRERRSDGSYAYPELVLTYDGSEARSDRSRAYGRFSHAGTYTTTVTKPELFASYLREQLSLIAQDGCLRLCLGFGVLTLKYFDCFHDDLRILADSLIYKFLDPRFVQVCGPHCHWK